MAGLRFGKFEGMKHRIWSHRIWSHRIWSQRIWSRRSRWAAGRIFLSLLLLSACVAGWGGPPAAADRQFNDYILRVESRLVEQHRSPNGFLASVGSTAEADERLHRGELIVEKLTPAKEAEIAGALVHHWRGTAFVRGATVVDFERLMKDVSGYPRRFSPQIVLAGIVSERDGPVADHFRATVRVRQRHLISVVMDTAYDVRYGHIDPRHGYSVSRSTRISEIRSAGTPEERALGDGEEHGFLWRMNTYWSYEECDGGLYMQVESVSLTRSIPAGLGWVVRALVESVPRESLAFTLRAISNALRK